jgi:hypothetical protein
MIVIKRLAAASLVAFGLCAGLATAQEIRELKFDALVKTGMMNAEILEMMPDERMLTVRLEETEEMATLIVPEDSDIIRTFPNNIEREIELSDLNVGDMITVEGYEVEGVARIRIIELAA